MAEVLFGCVIGLVVAWLVSIVWPLPDSAPVAGVAQSTSAQK